MRVTPGNDLNLGILPGAGKMLQFPRTSRDNYGCLSGFDDIPRSHGLAGGMRTVRFAVVGSCMNSLLSRSGSVAARS